MNERQFSIRVSLSEFHRIMAARTLKTDRQRRLNSLEGEENQQTKRKTRRTLCIQWLCHGVSRGWERNSTTGRFGHVLFSIYIHSRT